MSEIHSTKPHPFTLHKTGQYCKKIRGKIFYFGKDLDAALAKWEQEKDDLLSGRTPKADTNAVTVKYVCNRFLAHKKEAVDTGRLSPRTWADYRYACNDMAACFGQTRLVANLGPDDFNKLWTRLAEKYGPHRQSNHIQTTRSVFHFAYEVGLLEQPMRFGSTFKKPSKKTIRLHKAKQGVKLFKAEEIHRLINAAGPALKAMILLGINAGFGNADCGTLPLSVVDLDAGWIEYPRPKTGVLRRCPLWNETVAAIRASLAVRPEPKSEEFAGLVFLTCAGGPWHRKDPNGAVASETRKLLWKLSINGRVGLGFYTLRHTFRTVADEVRDQPAVDFIMGHDDGHISGHYRERISDERLRAVTDLVHKWLFG